MRSPCLTALFIRNDEKPLFVRIIASVYHDLNTRLPTGTKFSAPRAQLSSIGVLLNMQHAFHHPTCAGTCDA
eukprot:1157021-Pelagomonas_calceolata.AAC.3